MKRRNYWVLFAILLLALINLSPSETSTLIRSEDRGESEPVTLQDQLKEQEPGKIKVAVQLSDAQFLRLQQMSQKVMEGSHIQVELTNLAEDQDYETIREELELGDSPDILLLGNTWVRRFASGGYLLPTESYYSGSLTGEVLSASLTQNEWNGYVWAVPMDADPYVWVYDPDRLKELGMDFPLTQAEWKKLINEYLKHQPFPYLLAIDYNDPYAVISLMWQLAERSGTTSVEDLFKPTEGMETTLQQLDLLRPFLVNFHGFGGGEEAWAKLRNGEIALALVRWSEAEQHTYQNIKMAYPAKDNGMWVDGRSYAVSARSKNIEAAGEWISAMTSQLQQRQWFEMTGNLPVLKTMYYQAARNGLPSWLPASLINGKEAPLPVGAELPSSMEKYAVISSAFLNGELALQSYMIQLDEL